MDGNALEAVQRTGHVATVHASCLYLWGGYKESQIENNQSYLPGSQLLEYDPLLEQWCYRQCFGNPPPGSSGTAAVKVNDNLYCFGGYRGDGNTNDLYCLNMKTLFWHLVPVEGPKPIPCDKMVSWAHNERLFFFGGFGHKPENSIKQPSGFSFVLDDHTPYQSRRGWNNQLVCFDIQNQRWSAPEYKGEVPVARAAHASAKVGNKVFIMGGRHLALRMSDIHCFDTETLEWSGRLQTSGGEPMNRSWHSLTALTDTCLLLYGGFSQENIPLSDCWLLNLSNLTWTKLDLPLNRPRLWHTASLLTPGEIFICGGCSENILNPYTTHEHNLGIIVLRFSPKSLLRLCMDKIVECQAMLYGEWKTLPGSILRVLCSRTGSSQSMSLGGS